MGWLILFLFGFWFLKKLFWFACLIETSWCWDFIYWLYEWRLRFLLNRCLLGLFQNQNFVLKFRSIKYYIVLLLGSFQALLLSNNILIAVGLKIYLLILLHENWIGVRIQRQLILIFHWIMLAVNKAFWRIPSWLFIDHSEWANHSRIGVSFYQKRGNSRNKSSSWVASNNDRVHFEVVSLRVPPSQLQGTIKTTRNYRLFRTIKKILRRMFNLNLTF